MPDGAPHHEPSGTPADAWVIYLLTAREALGGGPPAGPWAAWVPLYRRHTGRAAILWWWQILVLCGAWAMAAWTGVMGVFLGSVTGWGMLLPLALLPAGVVLGMGVAVALSPLLFARSLARHLGLPTRRADVPSRDPPG